MSLLLAYYGDDFTGSTDALEFLARAGARTVLFTGTPTPELRARFSNAQAIGVAGCTRALAPDAMDAELRPAFTALRSLGAAHVHYKVCSTFDSSPTIGSIGRAIEVGRDVFGSKFVPLVVGAPPLGRYCVFGNLFARFGIGSAGAIHRLDRHPAMKNHPVTPADESDLRLHLARQTNQRIGLLDVVSLVRPESDRRATLERVLNDGAEIVLFDVVEPFHLELIGGMIEPLGTPERPLFSVGSSAIEMALGLRWQAKDQLTPRTEWVRPEPARPLLVVSGSCSPVTIGQIAWALRQGFVDVGIDPVTLDADVAIQNAVAQLKQGRHVIVHSSPERAQTQRSTPVSSEKLGTALGRVARAAIQQTGVKRLLVAGGDTSSYAARALGIEAVEMIAPLAPGAPLCRAHAASAPLDGLEVNFKGGQVGAENYFGAVARGAV